MRRTDLLTALETITVTRREAQAELDAARAVQLAATDPPASEELTQTLGGLVRQLDNAARELADAIRTCDQRERVLGNTLKEGEDQMSQELVETPAADVPAEA